MPDLLTAPEPTPPSGVPVAADETPPEPDGHTGAWAASCGYCQSVRDWWNESSRRG